MKNHKIVTALASIVLVTGLISTFGWFFDIDEAKSVLPGSATMKFGTAISFVCTGLALLFILRMRQGKAAFAQIGLPTTGLIIIMFLTVNTLATLLGSNISPSLLFEEPTYTPAATVPIRPSIGTLISFTLVVVALIFSLTDFIRAGKLLIGIGIVVGLIGGIALTGYAISIPILYYDFEEISNAMAVHTSASFLVIGSALVLLGSDRKEIVNIESIQIRTKLVSLSLIISIIPIIFLGSTTYILIRDFEVIRPFGYSFAVIGAVSTLAAGIFAYFVTREIIKPIDRLKNAALSIARGNLNIKATEDTTDEIGQLAKTFNIMVDGIKKTAELQLETQRLQQIDKDKEEFAAMISHELKTPLIPISGYSELFLDGSLGNMNEIQKEKMQIIYENSIRLTTLIQDILDVRKVELGRLTLDIRTESIKEIVERSIAIFKPIAERKGVTLLNETQDNSAKCDPDRILQVLNNIISNALKFVSEKHGTVSINSRIENNSIVVSVTDNGVGIPKDKQDGLFRKFYQVDKSLTRKSGGTGLGLAISRGIIEAHGGKIWVESKENEGTTVYFTLSKGVST